MGQSEEEAPFFTVASLLTMLTETLHAPERGNSPLLADVYSKTDHREFL
jgi:hypothetical protein